MNTILYHSEWVSAAWKDLLDNHQHLMIQAFRRTGLSLKLDGSEDHTLDFDGDHEPFAPMVPSGDEDSDSETESEKRNDSDTETE